MCTLLDKASRHEKVWTDEAVSSHVINLDVDKLLTSRPSYFILGREPPVLIKYETA
jgi:hypothetical protein